MNRPDAVNIIDHALAQHKSEKSSRSSGGEGSSTSHSRSKSTHVAHYRGRGGERERERERERKRERERLLIDLLASFLTSAVYGTDPVITRGINDSGIVSQSASEELGKL